MPDDTWGCVPYPLSPPRRSCSLDRFSMYLFSPSRRFAISIKMLSLTYGAHLEVHDTGRVEVGSERVLKGEELRTDGGDERESSDRSSFPSVFRCRW
jgi:hypothetical protein